MTIDLSAAFDTFLAECRDLLDGMESSLAALEIAPDDRDHLNAVFRVAHTIKGSAGMFGLHPLVAFTHEVETVLDQWRAGRLHPDRDLLRTLLTCRDHMSDLVASSSLGGCDTDPVLLFRDEQLRKTLAEWASTPQRGDGQERETRRPGSSGRVITTRWLLRVAFPRDFHRCGGNPLLLLRMVTELGHDASVIVHTAPIPPLTELQPEDCLLHVDCVLDSDEPSSSFASMLEFVDDECVAIFPPGSDLDQCLATLPGDMVAPDPDHDARLRASLAGRSVPTHGAPAASPDTGSVERQAPKVSPKRDSGLLRVRSERLDALINLVGELVVAGAAARSRAEHLGDRSLGEAMGVLSSLLEEMREQSLRLRMMPIGEVFERYRRTLREISGELGKDVELVVEGGDTELDKGMVDRLVEPLTHLVRNAADHGIEPPETRLAAGKPTRGRVTLAARHEHGSVVIEVRDDGSGLNPARILDKARRSGLVDEHAELSPEAVLRLVFEPGFSTAERVTDLSGRGVGMDVVRREIEDLRGQIDVESRPGAGTCFHIRLPLTLAIIDGFLVTAGGARFVLPLDVVGECIEAPADPRQADHATRCMDLRGELLPLIRLDRLFHLPERPTKRRSVVVVTVAGRKAGVVVDALLGEHQTVIKPMGELFDHVSGVAGSTVLPDGSLALVLDARSLLDLTCTQERSGGSRPVPSFPTGPASTAPSTLH